MQFLKKYWYLLIITVITVALGVITFITSQQLTKTTPVAPNVPQEAPRASTAACTLTFSLAVTTPTNTPTPTPKASCNNGCSENTDCADGLICSGNTCRNASCTEKTNCVCDVPTPTNTPTPTPLASCNNGCTVNADCAAGLVCESDSDTCRNPSCTEKSNCTCDIVLAPTPTPLLSSCNNGCTVNTDCAAGLVCDSDTCRNPSCTEKTNCTCDIAEAAVPTPQTPVAGTGPSVLGASIIGSAFLLILLGLAL